MQKWHPEAPIEVDAEPKEARPNGSRTRTALLLMALVAVAAAGMWSLLTGAPSPRKQPAARHPETGVTVQVGTVTLGTMPVTLDALGTVTSPATVTV